MCWTKGSQTVAFLHVKHDIPCIPEFCVLGDRRHLWSAVGVFVNGIGIESNPTQKDVLWIDLDFTGDVPSHTVLRFA